MKADKSCNPFRAAAAALLALVVLAPAGEVRADPCSASTSVAVSRSTGGTCDDSLTLNQVFTLTYRLRNSSSVDGGPNDDTPVESTIFGGSQIDGILAQETSNLGATQLPGVLTFVPVCPADSVGGLLNPGDECDPDLNECGTAECGCETSEPGVVCEADGANGIDILINEDLVFAPDEQKNLATIRVRVTGLVGPPAVCGQFFTRFDSAGDILFTTDDLCDSEVTAGAQGSADLYAPGCDVEECDDGIPCTTDQCNETGDACENIPDDSVCDDDAFCNGEETCDPLEGCEAGDAVVCNDGVGCTEDECNEETDECDATADNSLCTDNLFCNGTEVCDLEEDCQPGTPPDCDDAFECTTGVCNEDTDMCVQTPDNSVCVDGLFCNGNETCNPSTGCVAGIPVPCGDPLMCTRDSCNEATDMCEHDFSTCICGDSEVTGDEDCDPPAQAGSFEDCNNGLDDDLDGSIDCRDTGCKPGSREPICSENCELDEPCDVFIRDPARITFGRNGQPDEIYIHGRIPMSGDFQRVGRGVVFELSNPFGAIYRAALGPGDMRAAVAGRYFRFRDKDAEQLGELSTRGGIDSVRFRTRKFAGVKYIVFTIRAYGDLKAANYFRMTTKLSAGPEVGYLTAEWTATPRGWLLHQKDFTALE
jgi:hypothetical protein